MKRGQVVGQLWPSRQVAGLSGQSLKLVVLADSAQRPPGAPADPWAPLVVATDPLSAPTGQQVLVAFGSAARSVLASAEKPAAAAASAGHNRHLLADAAIALLIDGEPPSDD